MPVERVSKGFKDVSASFQVSALNYDLWDDEYLREILEDDYNVLENRDSNPVKSSDFNKSGAKNDGKFTS